MKLIFCMRFIKSTAVFRLSKIATQSGNWIFIMHYYSANALRGRAFVVECMVTGELQAVIHVKLNRVCSHPESTDLIHFKFNIRINQVIGEYTASFQKFPVFV